MVGHVAGLLVAAATLGFAVPCLAASVLVDLAEGTFLEGRDADVAVDPGRVADLLLVEALRERVHENVLAYATMVPVVPVRDDPGPRLADHTRLPVGELLQALLLSDSRTAAASLTAAAGPGTDGALARMRYAAARLRLRDTTVTADWLGHARAGAPSAARPKTTVRDLARLAMAVAGDAELRRRLLLDGVPIANGDVILRATSPLICIGSGSSPQAPSSPTSGPFIALVAGDGLDLLAVATGPGAASEVWATLDRGLTRYQRVTVVDERQRIGGQVRVRGGVVPRLDPVAGESFAITFRREGHTSLALSLQLPPVVTAPVEVDQPVGELVIQQGDHVVGVVPLVAPRAIAPRHWLTSSK